MKSSYWDSPYIIAYHKWNMEKWHLSKPRKDNFNPLNYRPIALIRFCLLKFNICVRCDMAFIQPMHHNKPNFTYLLGTYLLVGHVSLQVRAWCHWHTRFLPITRTLVRVKMIRWSEQIAWKKRKPNTAPSHTTRLILGLQTANERRRYNVTPAGCKTRISPDTTWHFAAYFRENSNPMENVPLS